MPTAGNGPESSRAGKPGDFSMDCILLVNGREVGVDHVLKDGDVLTILPRRGRGEAPMPPIRQFKKHLVRTYGMHPVARPSARGRGDHEKWQHPGGWTIDVNRRKRSRKEVDQASVADLARKLEMPFGKVYEQVMEKI